VIVPDVNLLIYAYDTGSPKHQLARAWWRDCLAGREPIGIPPVVLFAFVRLITMARFFAHPMSPDEAAGHARSWLTQPVVTILAPPANHVEAVLSSIETIGTAGNLVTDAQIASLAMAYDAVVHTNDADFIRFEGLRWYNPLTGQGS
jgi:toxin-antitoxin system PIN domain toxin